MPNISIIIPIYNGENFVEKSVKTILENKIDKEVILIDDGSNDNTYD